MTSKEQARQLDFLESMKVFEEVYEDELPAGTYVTSGRWVDTMKTPTMWRSKYTARGYEEPHSTAMKFALKLQQQYEASVCSWQGVSTNEIRDTKLLWQIRTTTRRLKPEDSDGECVRPCWVSERLRDAGKNICLASKKNMALFKMSAIRVCEHGTCIGVHVDDMLAFGPS